MMNFASCVFGAFLCVFGFICLLYCLAELLFEQGDESVFLLICANEKTDNLEFKLKSARLNLGRLKSNKQKYIIILDNGMNDASRELAYKEAGMHADILIVRADELQNLM